MTHTPLAYPHLAYPRVLTARENAAIDAQCINRRYPND